MVQVLAFFLVCILLRLRWLRRGVNLFISGPSLSLALAGGIGSAALAVGIDGSCVRTLSIRHLGVEYSVRLRVVQLLALLVVHTSPQKVNALMKQINISE